MTASTPVIFHAGPTSMLHDPGVRVRRAQRRAPQAAVGRQVGRERERALHLGDAVGAHRRRADDAVARRGVDAGRRRSRRCSRRDLPTGDGDLLHGLDDPAVARAPAHVAGELLADLDSDGSGMRSSRAWAAMISPGVQNPHCTAPASTNACWTSLGAPGSASPSTVTIGCPTALRRQHEARAHEAIVDEHAARPALALLARALGGHQAEPLAQHVEQVLAEPGVGDTARSAPLTCSVYCSFTARPPGTRAGAGASPSHRPRGAGTRRSSGGRRSAGWRRRPARRTRRASSSVTAPWSQSTAVGRERLRLAGSG